jgi:hypothetical protein
MWLIMGFRESAYCDAPEAFFVGIFSEQSVALETCKSLNKAKKDNAFYDILIVQENTVYDYEWNVMKGVECNKASHL